MDYKFCLNNDSFPAENSDDAYSLLCQSFREILKLRKLGASHLRVIYDTSRDPSFLALKLAENYTFKNFIEELDGKGFREFGELIVEMFDKAPAISGLDESDFNDLSTAGFFYEDDAYNGSNDTLAIAWFFDAPLLSINTAARWSASEIPFAKYDAGGTVERFKIQNVSTEGHAVAIAGDPDARSIDALENRLSKCVFSEPFKEWYAMLDTTNRRRLASKLLLAHERDFDGGGPLFDTLHDADGMREMRVPFFPGGAIRVLFGSLPQGKFGIFIGFVKKSDNEGYVANIARATTLWTAAKQSEIARAALQVSKN